ncbi:hypothetical protein AAFF_G00387910 [Aldrovandia affinis]|uniref:Uncharacterized protein n=1 Tax=Aldrovandia affinis TaxID=143900 RepID=A0AAD7SEX7_9TELE|nr:hypothetical protein AAFF_G00387910 [Aldrovandia affinis]
MKGIKEKSPRLTPLGVGSALRVRQSANVINRLFSTGVGGVTVTVTFRLVKIHFDGSLESVPPESSQIATASSRKQWGVKSEGARRESHACIRKGR